ncbi:ABC transporter ATP-binding protein/permease [Streptococcus pneumoniae]|nr:ABC transporter ATP-binding protein/permease [Streptococcus pneumoniae]
MSIIQKLWWFFKLEKRRYLVGIVALILVSVLNLIPQSHSSYGYGAGH